jgi:hypothetical protein
LQYTSTGKYVLFYMNFFYSADKVSVRLAGNSTTVAVCTVAAVIHKDKIL